MVSTPRTAVYDEYLEGKMRVIVEALVEALMNKRPDDVHKFSLDWLVQWHRDHGPEAEDLERIRAERDLALNRRDALLSQLELRRSPSPDEPATGPGPEASRPGSLLSAGGGNGCSGGPQAARKDTLCSLISDEDVVITAADEAKEREKIQRMQMKDRRPGVSAQKITEERLENWEKPFYDKPPEARKRLKGWIDSNEKMQVLFGHLDRSHQYSVIDAMFPTAVETGDTIIRQGEEGDNFYIVDEGTFDVFVQRAGALPEKVFEYGPGGMFGELALMYNAQRAATVTATSPAKLWALDRGSFQMMLTTAENTKKTKYEGFLESIEILQDLTKYEITRLSDMLETAVYDTDEAIIHQGDTGNYFYILEEGEAKAFIGGERGELEVKHYTKAGEYFGEIALLKSATRKATVRGAGGGCTVLSVGRRDFDLVLGPIKDILGKSIGRYPQYAEFLREEEEREREERAEREKIGQMKDASRRQGVSAQAVSEERMQNWKPPHFEKPQAVRKHIKQVIKENERLQVLFGHLTDDAVLSVVDAMSEQSVQEGSKLITQGEEGDNFYIVDRGTFDVFVQRGDNPPGKVCEYGPGAMFGELALMYNAPRAATVVATSPATVWALDRDSFQLMLTTAESVKKSQYEEFLSKIDILKHLTRYELAQLSDMLETELFDTGEDIVKQGDTGSYFYIVEDGEAKAYINGDRGEVEVKHYGVPGEFFGEVALITESERRATVRAVGEGCSVLSVGREDFDRVLGPIRDILGANIDKYPAYAEIISQIRGA